MKGSARTSTRIAALGLGVLLALSPRCLHAQMQAADAPASSTNAPADAIPVAPQPTPTTVNPAPDISVPATAPLPALSQIATPSSTGQAQDEIKDIRPPFYFIRSLLWLWIILAILASAGLLVLLWHWFKPQRQLSAKTAYELTLEKLEQARALLREENPVPYAVLVSETIRTYLSQRFRTPSTRRTTEEFLRLMETNEGAPLADHRELLRHFLQACDLVKFARYQPTCAELEEVQQRAVGFVTATKPLPGAGAPRGAAA